MSLSTLLPIMCCLQSQSGLSHSVSATGLGRQDPSPAMREMNQIRQTGIQLPQRITLVKKPQGKIFLPGGEMSLDSNSAGIIQYWLMVSRKPLKGPKGSFITRQHFVTYGKEDPYGQDIVQMFSRYFHNLKPTLVAWKQFDLEISSWNRGSNGYYLHEVLIDHRYYSVLSRFKERLPKRSLVPRPPNNNGKAM